METASKCKLNVKCITFNEMGRGGGMEGGAHGRSRWTTVVEWMEQRNGEEEEVNKVGNAGQNSLL